MTSNSKIVDYIARILCQTLPELQVALASYASQNSCNRKKYKNLLNVASTLLACKLFYFYVVASVQVLVCVLQACRIKRFIN